MTTLPAGIAAEQAMIKQNIALSVLKQSAEADKKLVEILDKSLTTVQTSGRGNNVNLTA